MKANTLIPLTLLMILLASCTATERSGLYAPGNKELAAIQVLYKDATLLQLKDGYSIYTKGACTDCHAAKNIYWIDDTRWKGILDDMAGKASLSDLQKDAVNKYVLAIKAVHKQAS